MLEITKNPYNGDEWEKIIDKCYQLRYQSEGYQKVYSNYQGDAGIEGYTKSGIVYQCYCPEKCYTDNDLWEKQRDKVTRDINKLMANGELLRKMGVPKIKEWHFVTPEYRDIRILGHCELKRQEVIDKKKRMGLEHIDDEFKILIKVGEDFINEVNQLQYFFHHKFDITLNATEEIDYEECDSEKACNIRRKIDTVMKGSDGSVVKERAEKISEKIISYYLKGIKIKNNLRKINMDLYDKTVSLENMFKNEIEMKCLMSGLGKIPMDLYQEIISELEIKLTEQMEDILTVESISELKWSLISAWLADCPLEFY